MISNFVLCDIMSYIIPLGGRNELVDRCPSILHSWFFFVVLGAGPKAIEYERNRVPEDQRHGVSFVPAFPLFPAIAWLLWGIWPPFAANAIFWLHIALLVFSISMTIYYQVQFRRVHAARNAETENDGPNAA